MPQGGKYMVACAVDSVYARWGICFTLHLLCTISFVQICAHVCGLVTVRCVNPFKKKLKCTEHSILGLSRVAGI